MKMIKTLMAIGLLSLLLFPAEAQVFKSQSFLAVQAVYATNTLNITNLWTTGSVGTNAAGTIYTNQNARVVASTGLSTTRNLLQDVDLWALRDGSLPVMQTSTNGSIPYNQSYANISVAFVGGSGANSAVTFTVLPIFNGDGRTARESTLAADAFTFGYTATTTTPLQISTNVPLYKWPGVKGLRVARIVNADTDASSQVIITDLSLNGYVP